MEESLSRLPHFSEAFGLTFEDDPMDIPLVHSLRTKMILEYSQHEERLKKPISENSLLESIEAWIDGSATNTPGSGKKFLFILAGQTFSIEFYKRVLAAFAQWRRSQFQDVNHRHDPEYFDDLENACSYFIGRLST